MQTITTMAGNWGLWYVALSRHVRAAVHRKNIGRTTCVTKFTSRLLFSVIIIKLSDVTAPWILVQPLQTPCLHMSTWWVPGSQIVRTTSSYSPFMLRWKTSAIILRCSGFRHLFPGNMGWLTRPHSCQCSHCWTGITLCTDHFSASSFFLQLGSTSVMCPVLLTLLIYSWSTILVNKKNCWFPAIIVSLFPNSLSFSASLIFMFFKR